jgi:riboflavin kinase/FMN adenylyltransferase
MTVEKIAETAIAIGNFDGFHLGHRKIVDTLKHIAGAEALVSVVMTFIPNPKLYFKRDPYLINTDAQKKTMLETQGVDQVSVIDFPAVVNMSEEEFLRHFLIEKYHMKHIVMGENFRFGKSRKGDIEFLKRASRRMGFRFTVVSPVMLEGIRISSSLIRKQLAEADIPLSNRMLGRKYFIEGEVVKGDHVGRELGFPTINIRTANTLLPEGVFETRVEIGKESFDSITYIGRSPTFGGKVKKVETHIFDFDRKLYGENVRILFDRQLRGDMTFDSRESLIDQIKKDIDNLKVDKGLIF